MSCMCGLMLTSKNLLEIDNLLIQNDNPDSRQQILLDQNNMQCRLLTSKDVDFISDIGRYYRNEHR